VQVANLTRNQTALIRLHKEFAEAKSIIKRLPATPGSSSQRTAAPHAPAHLDLGLGCGVNCAATYKPNAPGGGLESTNSPPKREGHMGTLSETLKSRLVDLCERTLAALEVIGSSMTVVVGESNVAMWMAHLKVCLRLIKGLK
jgi:hypothetical protein